MPRPNKGKGRAAAIIEDERQPLLSSSSSTASAEYTVDTPAAGPTHRRWQRHAVIVAVSSLLLGVVVFIGLLGIVFAGIPRGETQNLWEHVTIHNTSVQVIDVSHGGVHVNVSAIGGVNIKSLVKGKGHGFWERLRRKIAYTISPMVPASVAVAAPEVLVYRQGGGLPLLNISIPGLFDVPLMFDTNPAAFSIEAVGTPIASAGEVWAWAQKAWAVGKADVVVGVREVHAGIKGLEWLDYSTKDLSADITVPMPALPNLPKPGKPLDLSQLVKLHDYSFTNTDGLRITASASLPNPGLSDIPYALPFSIGVDGTELARVVANPADVSPKAIKLVISGDITAQGGDALELFMRNFLRGKDVPIVVTGLDRIPPGHDVPPPPQWVLDTLPTVSLDLVFPGPDPKPEVVKSVTIENMHISEVNGGVAASGTVVAIVQLPEGFQSISVNVTELRPDVFVYDGPVEDDDKDDAGRPDPDNPPERAFGRIAPDYFLNSTTTPSKEVPGALEVRADFEDMALEVLDDRQSVFRSFVGKVLLHGGATAGIGGVADIQADLGVAEPLDISSLPVHGEFWVGRAKIVGF